MKTVVDVWHGNNVNVNSMGGVKTEEVCVSDGYSVGGVRLYKVELVLGRRKILRYRSMDVVVCHVTEIVATTEEHISCCHRW